MIQSYSLVIYQENYIVIVNTGGFVKKRKISKSGYVATLYSKL